MTNLTSKIMEFGTPKLEDFVLKESRKEKFEKMPLNVFALFHISLCIVAFASPAQETTGMKRMW